MTSAPAVAAVGRRPRAAMTGRGSPEILTCCRRLRRRLPACSRMQRPGLTSQPAPDAWSAHEIVPTCAPLPTSGATASAGCCAEDRPTIRYRSPRGYLATTDYLHQDFHGSLLDFSDTHGAARYPRRLSPAQWSRGATVTGTTAGRDATVIGYAARIAEHEVRHLAQLGQDYRRLTVAVATTAEQPSASGTVSAPAGLLQVLTASYDPAEPGTPMKGTDRKGLRLGSGASIAFAAYPRHNRGRIAEFRSGQHLRNRLPRPPGSGGLRPCFLHHRPPADESMATMVPGPRCRFASSRVTPLPLSVPRMSEKRTTRPVELEPDGNSAVRMVRVAVDVVQRAQPRGYRTAGFRTGRRCR